MRGSAFIAFFGIATAVSGTLIGCGDDEEPAAKITKSGANESCTRTDDCKSGLSCVSNICTDSGSGTGGTDNTGGSAGKGGTTSSPLGGEGETCSRRADCQTTFGCFNGRCAETDTGEGGGPGVGPTVGTLGETCLLTSDCGEGLSCRPTNNTTIGVCTPVDSDVAPTGNVCALDECRTAEDCCELPINLQATLLATSCAEITDLIGTTNCATTTTVALQQLCFARDAYCECAANAWDCTNGTCSYAADCTASGMVPGGCPTSSRTGRPLVATCDTADSGLCQSPAVDPPCVRAADCDTLSVTDFPADTCEGGECTCFESQCLRMCDEDFDCAIGFECDTGDHVCIPAALCTTNTRCQDTMNDIRARCTNGICTLPCEIDLDCSPLGLVNGMLANVCEGGSCTPLGCTDDNECPGGLNGARTLCTPQRTAVGSSAMSAITD